MSKAAQALPFRVVIIWGRWSRRDKPGFILFEKCFMRQLYINFQI